MWCLGKAEFRQGRELKRDVTSIGETEVPEHPSSAVILYRLPSETAVSSRGSQAALGHTITGPNISKISIQLKSGPTV